MRFGWILRTLLVLVVAVAGVLEVAAKDPVFVRWMNVDDAGDRAILDYWERAEREELSAPELIDLGTMLFHRGFAKDAVEYLKAAADADPDLIEAWFRIGLVEHKQGSLRRAKSAYGRCLDMSSGHGWCNFYMGLLLEETGHANQAIAHFQTAFRHAPELANPEVNPEVLYSELALAGMLRRAEKNRFTDAMPMRLLQPAKVHKAGGAGAPATPDDATTPTVAEAPGSETETQSASSEATEPQPQASNSRDRSPQRIRAAPGQRPTPTPRKLGESSEAGASGSSHRGDRKISLGAPRIADVSPEASVRRP